MMFSDNILDKVSAQADDLQPEVVSKAMDMIEKVKLCTYRGNLPIYVDIKLQLRRISSDWGYGSNGSVERELEIRQDKLRERMYSNPCEVCDTCKSRTKKWPDTVKSDTTPVFFKETPRYLYNVTK